MKLQSIWHGMNNGSDFHIVRPNGISRNADCVILTKAPAYFRLEDGVQLVRENHLIIFQRGALMEMQSCGIDFVHDWFHLLREEEDNAFWESLHLPYARAIPLSSPETLSWLVREMAGRFGLISPYGERIQDAYLRSFFLLAADAANLCSKYQTIGNAEHTAAFHSLRRSIYEQPSQAPSAENAAAGLFLSRVHFDTLYKQYFGESFQNDVINSRIQQAMRLLQSSDFAVAQIAELCGYQTVEHFIRQFKSHTGETPSRYRRNRK